MVTRRCKILHCAQLLVMGVLWVGSLNRARAWGFYAHRQINRCAVFTLPPPLLQFYKTHITYITENSVNADKRRYTVPGEAQRHFFNTDYYRKNSQGELPKYWQQARERYSEAVFATHGTLPWTINQLRIKLTQAFIVQNKARILRISADLGHYIGDANVPLHTTANYDGQLTGQEGIHGLWESRIPELFAKQFSFFVGRAAYLVDPQAVAWEAVEKSYVESRRTLETEANLAKVFSKYRKYTFETRGKTMVKVFTRTYTKRYHEKLEGQVAQQMCAAIKMLGDFWYTAWVDAGKPPLNIENERRIQEENCTNHYKVNPALKAKVWEHPE